MAERRWKRASAGEDQAVLAGGSGSAPLDGTSKRTLLPGDLPSPSCAAVALRTPDALAGRNHLSARSTSHPSAQTTASMRRPLSPVPGIGAAHCLTNRRIASGVGGRGSQCSSTERWATAGASEEEEGALVEADRRMACRSVRRGCGRGEGRGGR